MYFSPMSRGPLYDGFLEMWKKITLDDLTGATSDKYYGYDKWKVKVGEGKAVALTSEIFLGDNLQLEGPFLFDAGFNLVW